MASNNSAREIAGERPIFEKEKFAGLRPSAYVASKVAFLACLVIVQSLWMAFFVDFFGPFRGNFLEHVGFLLLVNGAMTAVCLGISGLMRTAEQASLLSIYLVGFQLPLSGAVLALPEHIEALTRPFIKQRSGRITNIASVIGLIGNAGQSNYAASKAALIGFTKSVAKELAPRGITANAIAPGFIETDMTAALDDKVRESIIGNVPLGRFGSPDDIAHAAVFLAMEPSGYITGQVLTVDGGMVM